MSANVQDFPPQSEEQEVDYRDAAMVAHAQIEEQVRQRPYAAMAAGVGIGLVLGGGIPSWALRLAATSVSRIAVAYALGQLATEVVED